MIKRLLFSITVVLIALALGFVFLIYTNDETHKGTVTSKLKDKNNDDAYYIVLDNDTTIKNSSLMFKSTETSEHMQNRVHVFDKVEVKTVGYEVKALHLYKTAYELKVKED